MRISDWSSDVCSSDLVVIVDTDLEHRADRVFDDPRHRSERRRLPLRADQRDVAAELHAERLGEPRADGDGAAARRSEEHTSELQSLMRISYAVFCLNKNKHKTHNDPYTAHPT